MARQAPKTFGSRAEPRPVTASFSKERTRVKGRSSFRRGAFAGAIAALSLLLVCGSSPVAAKTMNVCAVEYGYRDKRLKEGSPLTVTGLLETSSAASALIVVLNSDDKSCEVLIDVTDAQLRRLETCGNGAKATISGTITEELFLAAVVPTSISCD